MADDPLAALQHAARAVAELDPATAWDLDAELEALTRVAVTFAEGLDAWGERLGQLGLHESVTGAAATGSAGLAEIAHAFAAARRNLRTVYAAQFAAAEADASTIERQGFWGTAADTAPGAASGPTPSQDVETMPTSHPPADALENRAQYLGSLRASAEEQVALSAELTGRRRRPARTGEGDDDARGSDTDVLAEYVYQKSNLAIRQGQRRYIAVSDRRSAQLPLEVSDPARLPDRVTRYYELQVNGDVYEHDRTTGQRRWVARLEPAVIAVPLEEGVQDDHRRRDADAGQTDWHAWTAKNWWEQ